MMDDPDIDDMDEAGALTLLAAIQGHAAIKRRIDGSIVYQFSGETGEWKNAESPAQAWALIRADLEARKPASHRLTLINVQKHELVAQ